MNSSISRRFKYLSLAISIAISGFWVSSVLADAVLADAVIAKSTLDKINELPNSPQEFIKTLTNAGKIQAAAEFKKTVEFDRTGDYASSIKILEDLHPKFPKAPYIVWRLSRSYWVYAENLDINAKEERLKYFQIGLDWANKGIALNDKCAECYLFKFGNLGRISTTKGLMNSISAAKDLSETIQKAIDLKPQHQDTYFNDSLANAYYASGVFYRIIPDWFIIKWIAGVRGDKLKSLEHIKKAAEITPARIDYQVELGAIYLCLAEDKGMDEMRALGNQALEHALTMEQVMPTDPLDKNYAKGFLKDPSGACGFSRDGIVNLDKKQLDDK
jgi:tetratricopeptide (TPR) repeat protein